MELSNLYFNESARPRLRESVTAFIDVLGFSQTVLATAEAGQSQHCPKSAKHLMRRLVVNGLIRWICHLSGFVSFHRLA